MSPVALATPGMSRTSSRTDWGTTETTEPRPSSPPTSSCWVTTTSGDLVGEQLVEGALEGVGEDEGAHHEGHTEHDGQPGEQHAGLVRLQRAPCRLEHAVSPARRRTPARRRRIRRLRVPRGLRVLDAHRRRDHGTVGAGSLLEGHHPLEDGRCIRIDELVDEDPVGQEHHAVGVGGGVGVVGDHDDGLAELVDAAAQEAQHLGAGPRVEVAGGLVGEDDVGPGGHRTGAGDALLLAAGELAGPVGEPVGQPDGADDEVEPLLVDLAPGDVHRQGDVLLGGQRRHEVEGLEHEAHALAAQPGQVVVLHGGQVGLADEDLALGGASPGRPCSA